MICKVSTPFYLRQILSLKPVHRSPPSLRYYVLVMPGDWRFWDIYLSIKDEQAYFFNGSFFFKIDEYYPTHYERISEPLCKDRIGLVRKYKEFLLNGLHLKKDYV